MDKETIMKKVAEIPFWWHHIELGYGIVTPGHYWNGRFDILQLLLEKLDLSKDLSGKSVIDIGAWDGFSALKLKKEAQVES